MFIDHSVSQLTHRPQLKGILHSFLHLFITQLKLFHVSDKLMNHPSVDPMSELVESEAEVGTDDELDNMSGSGDEARDDEAGDDEAGDDEAGDDEAGDPTNKISEDEDEDDEEGLAEDLGKYETNLNAEQPN